MANNSLIFDWNALDSRSTHNVELDDETLRDGLQSPSALQPTIDQKLEILHLMDAVGIHIADIGLPGAGPRIVHDALRLAKEIAENRMTLRACCASRTMIEDIKPIIEISQNAGVPIEVHAFIGSSPIRQYVEDWDLDRLVRQTRDTIKFAVSHGMETMYVTEDTTRSDPYTIRTLLSAAIDEGASRVCICDTVGHATPVGVRTLLRFVREEVLGRSNAHIGIDWHGHSDRGLALANALVAVEAGASRVHATCLGIGERAGNAAMDLLLVNLKLLGILNHDLTRLKDYCEAVANACGYTIAPTYPVFGRDAFRTGTGVHAAAIIKSIAKEEDRWLRDEIYSGVRARDFGFDQIIEIGPMSGRSNVQYWLRQRGLNPDPWLVDLIYAQAKASPNVLSENQILTTIVTQLLARHTIAHSPIDEPPI
jgi:2-isopropylmalate synthase